MKVSLNTYGGLTGGAGNPTFVVDYGDLDENARGELDRLVSAATAEKDRGLAPIEVRPDAQAYEITIEDDDGRQVVLEAADGGVPAGFAELRKWLREHSGS